MKNALFLIYYGGTNEYSYRNLFWKMDKICHSDKPHYTKNGKYRQSITAYVKKGNESEMVHCPSCIMDYFNFSFSAFRSSRLRSCSLAVLSTQRFRESIAKDISSSFLLIKAKSRISSSLILPSRAI